MNEPSKRRSIEISGRGARSAVFASAKSFTRDDCTSWASPPPGVGAVCWALAAPELELALLVSRASDLFVSDNDTQCVTIFIHSPLTKRLLGRIPCTFSIQKTKAHRS